MSIQAESLQDHRAASHIGTDTGLYSDSRGFGTDT